MTGFSIIEKSKRLRVLKYAHQLLAFGMSLTLMASAHAQSLPKLNADIARTTVSGLSSGAYMAGQFHLAYSQIVTGAAIVAGGPYGCARTPGSEFNPLWMQLVLAWNLRRAFDQCKDDGWWLYSTVPSPSDLFSHASTLSDRGKIDPVGNLQNDKVYLFTSSEDETVESGVVKAARDFYREAGVPQANIEFYEDTKAAHAFLTQDHGLECGETGPPYINDCDHDQAGALLNWLLGPLNAAQPPIADNFIRFAQSDFIADPSAASLGNEGMAYIPQSCRSRPGCTVHIVFHGCKQGLEQPDIGDIFVKQSGFANWAESNAIIMLFPQITTSTLNPDGCWDWWGYTGRNFLERDAWQMHAVKAMLDRLAESP